MKYRIEKISFENDVNGYLDKIFASELDGVIIEEFFSEKEIHDIKKLVIENRDSLYHADNGFFTFPYSFAQIHQKKIENQKYLDLQKFFDINTFYQRFIKLSKTKVIKPLEINSNSLFSTLRFLIPEKGEIKVHCENYFHQEFPEVFFNFKSKIKLKNQLSFFLVIQNPDLGGNLILYNFSWNEIQKRSLDENFLIKNGNYFDLNKSENIAEELKIKEGGMFIFRGGDIWHKVTTPLGEKSRITVGGFINQGINENEVLAWS